MSNETFTADHFRTLAQQCRDERARSWEDSDSDGFLSQWANQTMAHRYDGAADVIEAGSTLELPEVFDLAGNWLGSELSKGNYGSYYYIATAAGKARYFTPSSAASEKVRVKNDAKKGYYFGTARYVVSFDSSAKMTVGERLADVDNGQDTLRDLGII